MRARWPYGTIAVVDPYGGGKRGGGTGSSVGSVGSSGSGGSVRIGGSGAHSASGTIGASADADTTEHSRLKSPARAPKRHRPRG